MTFPCAQGHQHATGAERDRCDGRYWDATGFVKMAQVNFAGPQKIPRIYAPGRADVRDGVPVVIFSEEEIVAWELSDDLVDTDPGFVAPPDDEVVIDEVGEPGDED